MRMEPVAAVIARWMDITPTPHAMFVQLSNTPRRLGERHQTYVYQSFHGSRKSPEPDVNARMHPRRSSHRDPIPTRPRVAD